MAVATPSERAVEASAPALVTAAEPIDMSVNVLTQGYWPSYPAITVRLPEQLHRQQELFSRFYLSKHSGRKLLFQPTLGHCTLRAQFAPVRAAGCLFDALLQGYRMGYSMLECLSCAHSAPRVARSCRCRCCSASCCSCSTSRIR